MNVNDTDPTVTNIEPVVESSWSLPLVLFIVIVSTVSILGLKKLCEMAKEQIQKIKEEKLAKLTEPQADEDFNTERNLLEEK